MVVSIVENRLFFVCDPLYMLVFCLGILVRMLDTRSVPLERPACFRTVLLAWYSFSCLLSS